MKTQKEIEALANALMQNGLCHVMDDAVKAAYSVRGDLRGHGYDVALLGNILKPES